MSVATGTFVPPATNHQGSLLVPARDLEEVVPVNGTKSPRGQWYRLETNRVTMTDISIYDPPAINDLFDSDPSAAVIPSAGTTVVLTMDSPVNVTNGTGFTLGGSPSLTVTNAVASNGGNTVTLTLSGTVYTGETRTVTYNGATGNMKLKDTDTSVGSFTSYAVTNNTTQVSP